MLYFLLSGDHFKSSIPHDSHYTQESPLFPYVPTYKQQMYLFFQFEHNKHVVLLSVLCYIVSNKVIPFKK